MFLDEMCRSLTVSYTHLDVYKRQALGYSEAMIIEYNKKSKFRLSLKTLYGGKQTSDEDEFGEE